MIRLFLLYAILIFAKKAPKLIADLLKLDNKDGVGLKGLNIKNKMGEAALVGDKVKKGMNALEGRTKGALGGGLSGGLTGFAQGYKNTPGGLKAKLAGGFAKGLAGAGKGAVTGGKNGAALAKKNGDSKGTFANNYKDVGKAVRGGKDSIWDRAKNSINGGKEQLYGKFGISSLKTARANEVETYKTGIKNIFGSGKENAINKEVYDSNGKLVENYLDKKLKKQREALFRQYRENGVPADEALERAKADLASQRATLKSQMFSENGDINLENDMAMDYVKSTLKGVSEATGKESIMKLGFSETTAISLISGADPLILKKNILKEREKVLNNIQDYDAQIERAMSIGDEDLAKTMREKRDATLQSANNIHLFDENGGNVGKDGIGVPSIDTSSMDALRADLSATINKNAKMLAGAEKDIQARDAVEAANGTDKDKKDK